jgi:hypothetical protein
MPATKAPFKVSEFYAPGVLIPPPRAYTLDLGATLSFNLISGGIVTRTITINSGQVPSTQTNFPVLVNVIDPTLKSVSNGGHVVRTDGFDIGFYSDVGLTTKLKWEVERYDPVAGELVAHVKIASLASGSVFYFSYGSTVITTDQSDPVNVWTNSFLGVYHLKDGTTLNVNSATGSNNGTNNGATVATGQIDGGASFASASSQYIDLGTGMNPSAITYSCWYKATSFPNAYNTILARYTPGGANGAEYSLFEVKSNGKLAYFVAFNGLNTTGSDGTGTNTLSTGVWYYLVMTYQGSVRLRGFVNGTVDVTNTAGSFGLSSTAAPTWMGRDPRASSESNAIMDEARVASVLRADDWVTTEYNNQSSPSTFMTIGPETGGNISTQPLTKLSGKTFTPTLTFSGNFRKGFSKSFAATLNFIGLLNRRTFKQLTATLSFVGTFLKGSRFFKTFTATLSFVGNLTTNLIHGGALFLKNLTGTLSFSGSLNRRTGKNFNATLTFVGNFRKTFALVFGATLAFTGQLVKRTNKFFNSTLSFVATFIRNIVSTWTYYIDLRPNAFKPTQSTLETTVATSTLTHTEAGSTLSIKENTSDLRYTEAESSNFRNVKTNDDS